MQQLIRNVNGPTSWLDRVCDSWKLLLFHFMRKAQTPFSLLQNTVFDRSFSSCVHSSFIGSCIQKKLRIPPFPFQKQKNLSSVNSRRKEGKNHETVWPPTVGWGLRGGIPSIFGSEPKILLERGGGEGTLNQEKETVSNSNC